MVSDDTEHACMTAQAWHAARGDPGAFECALARSLRWWLLGLPAGIGRATLVSIVKLWAGVPPSRSGVFSAGNGPVMRAPILGVLCEDAEQMAEFVARSTRITHRDPKARYGALATALAARMSASRRPVSPCEYMEALRVHMVEPEAGEFLELASRAAASAESGEPLSDFVAGLGSRSGVSGYVYHTVSAVLHVWFRHPADYAAGVREIILAGGDTDSTAAILGGITGARVGREGIPEPWLSGLLEWPRGVAWMEQAATGKAPRTFVPGLLCRNALFLIVVLLHGLRRLLPPY